MADNSISKTSTKSFPCNDCKFVGSKTLDTWEHVQLAHTDNPEFHDCDKCDYKTVRKRNLAAHMNSHHADSKAKTYKYTFPCSICDFVCGRKDDMREHIQSAHIENPQFFQCDKCDYKSIRKRLLAYHMKTHFVTEKLKCNICDAQLKNVKMIAFHKKSVHDGKKYNCKICGKLFSQSSHLRVHQRSLHTDIFELSQVECDICSKKFKNKGYLKKHKKSHQSEYVDCKECGKRKKSTYLPSHKRKFHTERPFLSCKQCDYKTKHNNDLKVHLLGVHSMAEKTKCEFCSYEGAKDKLKKHFKNSHTNHEKLTCDLCDYEGINVQLARHIRRVHNSVNQTESELKNCTFCTFRTKRKVNLKKHIDSVHLHLKEVVECETCHRKIAAVYLKQHILRAHGNYMNLKNVLSVVRF